MSKFRGRPGGICPGAPLSKPDEAGQLYTFRYNTPLDALRAAGVYLTDRYRKKNSDVRSQNSEENIQHPGNLRRID